MATTSGFIGIESVFYGPTRICHVSRKETLFWFEVKDLLEMEMVLLEDMAFSLAIFHPYRPLPQLLEGSLAQT